MKFRPKDFTFPSELFTLEPGSKGSIIIYEVISLKQKKVVRALFKCIILQYILKNTEKILGSTRFGGQKVQIIFQVVVGMGEKIILISKQILIQFDGPAKTTTVYNQIIA
jgi:hypothetical protein